MAAVPRIGEALVARGACDQEAVRQALENQIIFGGRLGTNLLEIGAVTEEVLAEVLGERYGAPYLSGELELDPDAVSLVRPELADRFDVVPYVLSARRVGVLCIDPTDLGVMDELRFVTGRDVHPIVVPEARLWALLKRAYGIERELRALSVVFASLRDTARPEAPDPSLIATPVPGPGVAPGAERGGAARSVADERRDLLGGDGDLVPEEAWLSQLADAPGVPEARPGPPSAPLVAVPAPPPPPLELPSYTRDLLARLAVETGRPPGGDAPAAPSGRSAPAEEGPLTLEAALPAIEAATDRDAIARVVLRHARRAFRRAMMLVVQGPVARGWVVSAQGVPGEAALGLELPLDAPGLVAAAIAEGEPLVAPLLHAESDVRLVDRLGGGAPSEAVAVPVATHGRIVNVIYADGGPGGVAGPDAVDELAALATFASRRYETLLGRI